MSHLLFAMIAFVFSMNYLWFDCWLKNWLPQMTMVVYLSLMCYFTCVDKRKQESSSESESEEEEEKPQQKKESKLLFFYLLKKMLLVLWISSKSPNFANISSHVHNFLLEFLKYISFEIFGLFFPFKTISGINQN